MKEINRKQLEVGDVWITEDHKRKIAITLVEFGHIFGVIDNGRVLWGANIEDFLEKHKYLGKAKNPITSIFEVENEK